MTNTLKHQLKVGVHFLPQSQLGWHVPLVPATVLPAPLYGYCIQSVSTVCTVKRIKNWHITVNWPKVRCTSNVTGCHRGPKRKLRDGHRALLLQRTSYLCVGLLLCCTSSIFRRRVWYRVLSLRDVHSMRVFEVSASSSPPRLPLCQISFLSCPPLLS